jgi:hypothetical protein
MTQHLIIAVWLIFDEQPRITVIYLRVICKSCNYDADGIEGFGVMAKDPVWFSTLPQRRRANLNPFISNGDPQEGFRNVAVSSPVILGCPCPVKEKSGLSDLLCADA